MGRSIFFEKNLRIQFDVVFDSESKGGIFDSLAPFGGRLSRFENLKYVRQLQPTQRFFRWFSCFNRHNSSPNGARESKIPPFDSESNPTSNYILRFFSKKNDLLTFFSFYKSSASLLILNFKIKFYSMWSI